MIRDILLPERIGNYYLFAQEIAGIEITNTHIYATFVHAQGTKIRLEKCTQTAIELDNGQDETERTAHALKTILQGNDKAEIHAVISSTQVVFKHLKVPFADRQKIQKIVAFEIEPLLPFAVHDAIIDFMIMHHASDTQSSSIMVAAVQKQYVEQQLALFSAAGLLPAVITVDIFQLYSLYLKNPRYMALTGAVVLVDIGIDVTKISYIVDGELRFVRTIHMGIAHISKALATKRNVSATQAREEFIQLGFNTGKEDYDAAVDAACAPFLHQLQFSLQSFTAQATDQSMDPQELIISGVGGTIKNIADWLTQKTQIKSSLFELDTILAAQDVNYTNFSYVPLTYCTSIAAALPDTRTQEINLRQQEFAPTSSSLFIKQLSTAMVLLLSTFILLFAHTYVQIRKLRNEADASKREAVAALRNNFKDISAGSIDGMLDDAREKVEAEERLWSPFSAVSRNSFLYYLLELTRLDKKSLELVVKKVTLDQDKRTMHLNAQVKDTDALVLLEQELRQSGLFSYVQSPDHPSFDMELRFAKAPGKDAQ